MPSATQRRSQRPRVLIVEDDPVLALSTVGECLNMGLEPKLCLGPDRASTCPGLEGRECPRTREVEATLLSIRSGPQRIAAPACIGGRLVLSGERPLLGAATVAALRPDARLSYPYDTHTAASLLFWLVRDERRRRAWDSLRTQIRADKAATCS